MYKCHFNKKYKILMRENVNLATSFKMSYLASTFVSIAFNDTASFKG